MIINFVFLTLHKKNTKYYSQIVSKIDLWENGTKIDIHFADGRILTVSPKDI